MSKPTIRPAHQHFKTPPPKPPRKRATSSTLPAAQKAQSPKLRKPLAETISVGASPLNGRKVQQARAKPPTSIQRKVNRFAKLHNGGLLQDKKALTIADRIKKRGFCSSSDLKQLETMARRGSLELKSARETFKEDINQPDLVLADGKGLLAQASKQVKTEGEILESTLQSLDYISKAQDDLDKLVKLSNKIQKTGELSKKEMEQFTSTLWKHKENMPILLEHLSNLDGKLKNAPDTNGVHAVLQATMETLAETHLLLADVMALHSDHLPDSPPVSRQQRLDHHLLQIRAARHAVVNLHENYFSNDTIAQQKLERMDQKLAAHEKEFLALKQGKLTKKSKDMEYLLEMPLHKPIKLSKAESDTLQKDLALNQKLPLAMKGMPQNQMLKHYIEGSLDLLPKPHTASPDIDFLQEQGKVATLNQGSWEAINNPINFEAEGAPHTVHSHIQPAGIHSALLPAPYEGKGVAAGDRLQYNHAVNLAHTALTNESGETIFSAHRSGVLDPYKMTAKNLAKLSDAELGNTMVDLLVNRGLDTRAEQELVSDFRSDPKRAEALTQTMHEQATQVMAEDLAATMILDDPALLEKAQKGEAVDLPIVSISLMTPDYLRSLGGKIGEKEMLASHRAALEYLGSAGEDGVSVRIKSQEVPPREITAKVKVKPTVLNLGVNAGAQRAFGIMGGNRVPLWRKLMGWDMVAPANNQALDALVGKNDAAAISGAAGEKIAQLKGEQEGLRTQPQTAPTTQRIASIDKQVSKITQLSNQIKTIWRTKSFMRETRDPYKLPSRVALLADAIGQKPLFHCKSGKDRTGQLDTEAKYLAAQFDATGNIPEAGAAPTQASRKARTQFALHGGSHEMQNYSAGMAGYKLKGVPALDKQFEPFNLPNYRSGSSFVGD